MVKFHGETFDEDEDQARLEKQHALIKAYMLGHGEFRTRPEIAEALGLSPFSDIRKRLNENRERRNGYHWVEVVRAADPALWKYKLHPAGTGDMNPKPHRQKTKTQIKAEKALAFAGALADALEELDPEHPLLKKWDSYRERFL